MEKVRKRVMEIKKIINNNIVSSIDKDGRELIVMGRGIGFGKKTGQMIDEDAVEKIFRMDVVSGEKEYLAEGFCWVYMENGYLYYTWNDITVETEN